MVSLSSSRTIIVIIYLVINLLKVIQVFSLLIKDKLVSLISFSLLLKYLFIFSFSTSVNSF